MSDAERDRIDAGPPPLAPGDLRWRCEAEGLPFATTDDVEPAPGVIGQDAAIEALRFGLSSSPRVPGPAIAATCTTSRSRIARAW